MSMISTTTTAHDTVSVGILQAVTAALKRWWLARMMRRMERLAAERLRSMSDRELRDIGLSRPEIDFAVRSDRERDRTLGRYV